MRLGTKILLLTLSATVGLSGTVIWLVTRDITAREVDRARHTINWAVSGYFQSVDERLERDSRLVTLSMQEPQYRAQLDRLEGEQPEQQRSIAAGLAEILGKILQRE